MAWNKKEVKEYIACLLKASVAISSVTFLFGCGGDNDNKSSSVEMSPREVATVFELGACNADRRGDTVLVLDKSIEYMCVGNNWIDITTWPGVPTTRDTSQIPDTSKVDIPYKSLAEVQTIYELGACTEQREGIRILVLETGMGYLCHSTQWQQMTVQSSSSIVGDSTVASNDSKKSESSSSNSIEDPLCVNCSSSSSAKLTYIEVATKTKLGNCDTAKIDLRALVLADSSYYTCMEKGWVKDSVYLGYEVVTARVDLPNCNDGNVKQRMLVKRDSIFFVCDTGVWIPETTDGYVVNNISVMGSAHKGPFKFNSPLELREVLLRNDTLSYSGRKYIDEVSSNAGDFVIPKVRMIYPYAVLEVNGIWRNEVTGEWSKDTMTLRALTELSEKVNVNLLTHLEYDRAINLIHKGYSVSAAKTQADYEIMTAFEITPTMSNSEAKETFGSGADPTLLAMAILFIGNRSDSEINNAINSFRVDIADDGVWNDEKTKAEMADWAENVDYSVIRANVKNWNISVIPDFEAQLKTFWNNAYGLGGCGQNRYNIVTPVMNSLSANYGVHYICKTTGWQKATDYEKDTYQWADGEEGEFKRGNVTETYYVFEKGKWAVAKNESALGLCTEKRNGDIGKVDATYFICENESWNKATVLEYDTYQFGAGEDGEVRPGKVNADKFYVYENGVWRASASEIENNLGACITSREGEKNILNSKYYICENKNWKEITAIEYGIGYCSSSNNGAVELLNNVYYICKSGSWNVATELEYDTYGKTCITDGSIVAGEVVTSNKYVCDAGTFRVANDQEIVLNKGCVSYMENEMLSLNGKYYICEIKIWKEITASEYLGSCSALNDGTIEKIDDVYYICKSGDWDVATVLEYDTYGKTCNTDGAIISGKIISTNKYVCDAGFFRTAEILEISLNKGCVSYTEGNEIRKRISTTSDSVYTCNSMRWVGSINTLYDKRNKKTYKTVVVGAQTWMAENLNYDDSSKYPSMSGENWCYKNNADSCAKYGRLYTWGAAMDYKGTNSNGKYCKYNHMCTPIYPVQGICPENWHVPDSTEWASLYMSMGQSPYALQGIGYPKWPNAMDSFEFDIRPAGYTHYFDGERLYENFGTAAHFWSSSAKEMSDPSGVSICAFVLGTNNVSLEYGIPLSNIGYSVRCVKD